MMFLHSLLEVKIRPNGDNSAVLRAIAGDRELPFGPKRKLEEGSLVGTR